MKLQGISDKGLKRVARAAQIDDSDLPGASLQASVDAQYLFEDLYDALTIVDDLSIKREAEELAISSLNSIAELKEFIDRILEN